MLDRDTVSDLDTLTGLALHHCVAEIPVRVPVSPPKVWRYPAFKGETIMTETLEEVFPVWEGTSLEAVVPDPNNDVPEDNELEPEDAGLVEDGE